MMVQEESGGTTTTTTTTTTNRNDILSFVFDSGDDGYLIVIRSIMLLFVCMIAYNNNTQRTFVLKLEMCIRSIIYFLFCCDKTYKKPLPDPGSVFGIHFSQGYDVDRKTIYFIRHGESTWNDTFNKGKHRSTIQFVVGFIPGLIYSIGIEVYLLFIGKLDSWFYDSPLSNLGLRQVKDLSRFLSGGGAVYNHDDNDDPQKEHIMILRGDNNAPKSIMICSNLRRAISTLIGGFSKTPRFQQQQQQQKKKSSSSTTSKDSSDDSVDVERRILIHNSLQEISRNPDTLCITPPYTIVQPSWIESNPKNKYVTSISTEYTSLFSSKHINATKHIGNKPLNTNGLIRMIEFCDFIFDDENVIHHHDISNIIVGGHSIWFRSFFQTFLPYSISHIAKEKKIVNCGIVSFELMRAKIRNNNNNNNKNNITGSSSTTKSNNNNNKQQQQQQQITTTRYMIDPKSIHVVYGGF